MFLDIFGAAVWKCISVIAPRPPLILKLRFLTIPLLVRSYVHMHVWHRAIDNVRKAIAHSYDYFDEEIYRTALEVFERQKRALRDKVKATGRNYY